MTTTPPASPSKPTKPPGERLASYFENFFRGVIGIATFGASITFSKIPDAPTAPSSNHGISATRIQYLIAISWLFFVLALACTSITASALSLYRPQAVQAFGNTYGKERRRVLWFATAVAAVLFGLLVVAFVNLGLVVVAYVGVVGWVAVGFTVLFALLGYGVMLWQSPLQWPLWLAAVRRRGEEDGLEKQAAPRRREETMGEEEPAPVSVKRVRVGQRGQGYEEGGYGRSTSGDYAGGGGEYGRSTSGDYAGGGGGVDWGVTRREDKFDRYSRTSTVLSDPYEPGRFGGEGLVLYDTGVREALVMSRYPD
ncbi:MAG: hypothetical protein Q9195_008794 [Heterodermia aff. obscurata]